MSMAFLDEENPAVDESSSAVLLRSTESLPNTLQNFLSHVGVVTEASSNTLLSMNENDGDKDDEGVVFESYFDLTEERLQFVFRMFDTDEDGRLSYDALREGLNFHNSQAAESLDATSFNYLVKHLDLDNSGDVSFEEFKEGIRLLMLRTLFHHHHQTDDDKLKQDNAAMVQVMDYESVLIEKYRVMSSSISRPPTAAADVSPNSTLELPEQDFYFQRRPAWVKTRWINVVPRGSRASAIETMNRIAIKYLLHPLALEDALLSPESHRPKAEMYTNHYFIMAPVFFIEWEPAVGANTTLDAPSGGACSVSKFVIRLLCGYPCRGDGSERIRAGRNSTMRDNDVGLQVHKIRSQMVSIFVTVPSYDTIITFTGGLTTGNDDCTDQVNDSSHFLWTRVQRELEKRYSKLRQYDAQYLTYALLDEAVDLVEPIMATMRQEIEKAQEFLRYTRFRDLSRIQHLKGELASVGRKFKPFLRLLTHVIEDDSISPGATVYLRDVLDNLECLDEELGRLIAACESLNAEASKVQSRQMDRTLYTLTVLSAVFLPAQFLTGVWGMNFKNMPELDEPWGYGMFWAISIFMMVSLVVLLNFGRLG